MKTKCSTGLSGLMVLVTCFVAVADADAYRQLYMVTGDEATLWQSRQAKRVLLKGEIVEAEIKEGHPDWLTVFTDSITYDAPRNGFNTRTDVIAFLEGHIARLKHDAEQSDLELKRIHNDLVRLYSARAAVQFDTCIEFRIKTGEQLIPIKVKRSENPLQFKGTEASAGTVMVRPIYKYVNKISRSRSRKLEKEWTNQIVHLEMELRKQNEQRRRILRLILDKQSELHTGLGRFKAFEENPETYLQQLYMVTQEQAVLYQNRRTVAELPKDRIVRGVPDRQYDDWLHISLEGQRYQSLKDHYVSAQRLEDTYKLEMTDLRQAREELQQYEELLLNRLDLLDDLRLSLEYESTLRYVPIRRLPFGSDYPGFHLYHMPRPPQDAVEVIDPSQARRTLRNWEQEEAVIEKQRDKIREKLRAVRQRQAQISPQYEALAERLRRVGGPVAP